MPAGLNRYLTHIVITGEQAYGIDALDASSVAAQEFEHAHDEHAFGEPAVVCIVVVDDDLDHRDMFISHARIHQCAHQLVIIHGEQRLYLIEFLDLDADVALVIDDLRRTEQLQRVDDRRIGVFLAGVEEQQMLERIAIVCFEYGCVVQHVEILSPQWFFE